MQTLSVEKVLTTGEHPTALRHSFRVTYWAVAAGNWLLLLKIGYGLTKYDCWQGVDG